MVQPGLIIRKIESRDYPDILHFEAARKHDSWNEHMLAHRLKDTDMLGFAAEIDGQFAGYLIYSRDNAHRQNSILKLTASPVFTSRAEDIQQAFLNIVKADMTPEGRASIVAYTSSDDEALIQFLCRSPLGFRMYKAQGTEHVMLIHQMPNIAHNFGYTAESMSTLDDYPSVTPPYNTTLPSVPSMDAASNFSFMMGPGLPDPAELFTPAPDTDEDMAAAPLPPPMSPASLVLRAREKLTELTGMEWEVVTLGKRGKFIPATPGALSDPSSLYLSTASKVQNPRKALEAVCEYLGQTPPRAHTAKLDNSRQIAIPATWVRKVHVTLGSPGQLAESFMPASTQLRYQCFDEMDERHQRKSGGSRER